MAEQAPPKGYTNRVIGQDVLDLPEHIKFLSMPIQGPSGDINGFDIEFKVRGAQLSNSHISEYSYSNSVMQFDSLLKEDVKHRISARLSSQQNSLTTEARTAGQMFFLVRSLYETHLWSIL